MSHPKKPETEPEVVRLRRELAETQRQVQTLSDQLQTVLTQPRSADDKQVININLPNTQDEVRRRSDELVAEMDARIVTAEAELAAGEQRFRVCVIDQRNKDTLEQHRKLGLKVTEPRAWPFAPFNPWRDVGARDELEAQAKYTRFFGIRSLGDGAEYVSYPLDDSKQPLEPVAAV